MPKPVIFLSHNARDKGVVRPLAAALQVTGTHVWFDEWVLKPGESVPGAISDGLARFEIFVLVWSENAASSNWVRSELNTALTRQIETGAARIVPVRLDDTPLPALVSHLLYLDARKQSHLEIAQRILGIESQRDLRKAVQNFLEEAELNFREYWGAGVLVGCPKCGASLDRIRAFRQIDDGHDATYCGAECLECGWGEASEM